jgi:hypothetical protein
MNGCAGPPTHATANSPGGHYRNERPGQLTAPTTKASTSASYSSWPNRPVGPVCAPTPSSGRNSTRLPAVSVARARVSLDRHATYIVAAYVAGAAR